LVSGEVRLQPGHPVLFSDEDGRKLLERARGKVRLVTPDAPLQPGWLVAYRDRQGRLRGGADERADGTVRGCRWDNGRWAVELMSGEVLPLSIVSAVSKTDASGAILSAWTVREHGYDGGGR
jgi:hypothetical protein